ncbi:MAG: hypothetical protein HKN51_17530 [Saprospiraceae bacterium]|nr:hypothetical protein [Saprospiraceae bacterium]
MKELLLTFTFFICFNTLTSQICHKYFNPDSCKITFLTEFGISKSISAKKRNSKTYDVSATAQMGYSAKVGNRLGLGGLIQFDLNRELHIGLSGRISYYLNNTVEMSLTPTIFRKLDNFTYKYEFALDYKNAIGIFSNIEIMNFEGEANNHVINLGIKTRGRRAPIGWLTTGGIVGFLVIIISASM